MTRLVVLLTFCFICVQLCYALEEPGFNEEATGPLFLRVPVQGRDPGSRRFQISKKSLQNLFGSKQFTKSRRIVNFGSIPSYHGQFDD